MTSTCLTWVNVVVVSVIMSLNARYGLTTKYRNNGNMMWGQGTLPHFPSLCVNCPMMKVHINDFYLFDLSQRGGGIRHNVSQHEIWSHHQVSKQRQHDVGSGDFAQLSITLCKLPDDEDLFLLNKLISLPSSTLIVSTPRACSLSSTSIISRLQ